MISVLKKIFTPAPSRLKAHDAYVRIVAQARLPVFYRQWGVADTLDGRFDVILLHMFLVIHRLRGETAQEAGEFIRDLSEVFFADMDQSLREMGSTDTGTGIRVKKMAQAFYGRLQAYEQTLLEADLFRESIRRNLFRDADIAQDKLDAVTHYALRNVAQLNAQQATAIISGAPDFLS